MSVCGLQWKMLEKVLCAAFLLLVPVASVVWSAPPVNDVLRVTAVGDIMMGSTYPVVVLPPDDGKGIFKNVREKLKGGDIIFGNLEGPLIDEGTAQKCRGRSVEQHCYEFRTPTRYVRHLAEAGFNAVSIANNHIHDFGAEGLVSTLATLKAAGIRAVGGKRVARFVIRGRKVAIVGFSLSRPPEPIGSCANLKEIQLIKELKEKNNIVIVSFHGGAEGREATHVTDVTEWFEGEIRGNVVGFSRAAVDAGADLVVGHGPHVIRAMEVYKGKLIAYSLGNFLTYGAFRRTGPSRIGLILKADIDWTTGNLISGSIFPVVHRGRGIPVADRQGEAIRLVKELTDADVTKPNLIISDNGNFQPMQPSEKKSRSDSLLARLRAFLNPASSKP